MNKLEEIKGKSPFRVPDNYFEEFNRRIIASTVGEETVKELMPDKKSIYVRFRPYILAAASVAAFAILSYGAVRMLFPSHKEPDLSEMSYEELSACAMNDLDITSLEANSRLAQFSEELPVLSKPELIDYIISENINLNDIYQLY
jgi:hypothetical protein